MTVSFLRALALLRQQIDEKKAGGGTVPGRGPIFLTGSGDPRA
jgi:hypothetical protein